MRLPEADPLPTHLKNSTIRCSSGKSLSILQLLRFEDRRAAGEFGERGVADVLEVRDADFAGVESVAGHLAKPREKRDPLGKRGIGLGVLPVGNEIEDLRFLGRRGLQKS